MSAHLIEADFTSELGHRVLVITCTNRATTCIADDLGRCTLCNQVAA